MIRKVILIISVLLSTTMSAQENLQREAIATNTKKAFTIVKKNPVTSVKNQWRSGTCWAYATLGYFESEILRKTGKTYDLCEMFVVNKDYMDCATHYVRMHGYSQISEGGSCDDVLEVIRQHGICPENAMPAPGSLTGDSLANFKVFFPELERRVSSIVRKDAKEPLPHWRDSVQAVIDRYIGSCPESFVYEGKTFTPRSFAENLGLDLDDYVSLTSFTHHPFNQWFIIEAPYKWRLKPSYNIPIEQLMEAVDKALDAGFTVAWGGDVSGDFTRTGLAMLPDGIVPTQQMRQEQSDLRFQIFPADVFTKGLSHQEKHDQAEHDIRQHVGEIIQQRVEPRRVHAHAEKLLRHIFRPDGRADDIVHQETRKAADERADIDITAFAVAETGEAKRRERKQVIADDGLPADGKAAVKGELQNAEHKASCKTRTHAPANRIQQDGYHGKRDTAAPGHLPDLEHAQHLRQSNKQRAFDQTSQFHIFHVRIPP